jgi:imipenem/basic amino acid-specific outer membrane pore
MASYGVPGLSFMGRYIYGKDVDGTHAAANGAYAGLYGADDRERETDIDVKYVIQSGPAKNLALRVRQAWHRGDASLGGDVDQFRLMLAYPLQIL